MDLLKFRLLAIVHLAPVALMHLVHNTGATGFAADVASMLFGATLLLIGFAALPWIGGALGIDAVRAKPYEWMFNALLVLFCVSAFFDFRAINVTDTGLASFFSLVWEWASLAVGFVAFLAFWAVKGDEVRHALGDDHGASAPAPRKRAP